MKFILPLALLFSLSASADSFMTGASEVHVKHEFNLDEGNYFVGASDVKEDGRSVAADKKKHEISMKDDAYFTGSSY